MQCTLTGLIDSMFTSFFPMFSFYFFFIGCLLSTASPPLRIDDTYALCFPSAHKLHSVHTLFLFGFFINFLKAIRTNSKISELIKKEKMDRLVIW